MRKIITHRLIMFVLLTATILAIGFPANTRADSCSLFNELFSGTSGNTWYCGSHGTCTINNGKFVLTNPESGYFSYGTTVFMPTGFFTIDADVTETPQSPVSNSPGIGIYPFTTGDLLFSISNVATDGFAAIYYPESSQMNFIFWDVNAGNWKATQYQAVTGPVTSIGMKVLSDKVVFRVNRKDTGISLPGVFTMPQVIDSLWLMASGSFSVVSFDNICANLNSGPTPLQPVLSVSPPNRNVAKDSGSTTFSVSNTGTGTMTWSASVTSGSWLTITSGTSGTNSGTINCGFTANTSSSARTATIRVTATGATGSPQDVTVIQVPTSTPTTTKCTATLDGNLLLHIPYLSYVNPQSGTLSLWADLVYESNPKQIIFKYSTSGIINNPSFSCAASTLSSDLTVHIPDVLLPDGSTHLWADLVYSTALSIKGNSYFILKNYGVVSN